MLTRLQHCGLRGESREAWQCLSLGTIVMYTTNLTNDVVDGCVHLERGGGRRRGTRWPSLGLQCWWGGSQPEQGSVSSEFWELSSLLTENDHNCCWEEIPLWARQGWLWSLGGETLLSPCMLMVIHILWCSVCLCVTKNEHFLLGVSCNHLNPL